MVWNVLKDERIEPPIQTEYFLSAGATTLIFIVDGARATISLLTLSAMPLNMVVPPDMTMLLYNSFSDINITFHDRLEGQFMDTWEFFTKFAGLE